jgi:hypothetical protein
MSPDFDMEPTTEMSTRKGYKSFSQTGCIRKGREPGKQCH